MSLVKVIVLDPHSRSNRVYPRFCRHCGSEIKHLEFASKASGKGGSVRYYYHLTCAARLKLIGN